MCLGLALNSSLFFQITKPEEKQTIKSTSALCSNTSIYMENSIREKPQADCGENFTMDEEDCKMEKRLFCSLYFVAHSLSLYIHFNTTLTGRCFDMCTRRLHVCDISHLFYPQVVAILSAVYCIYLSVMR